MPSTADLGLFVRRDGDSAVYVLVSVDDLFIVGPRESTHPVLKLCWSSTSSKWHTLFRRPSL
jgi:hypothetical protein